MGGCDLEVNGGNYSACVGTSNGAFMFASDGAVVTIKDATVTNGVAVRRGAVVRGWMPCYSINSMLF